MPSPAGPSLQTLASSSRHDPSPSRRTCNFHIITSRRNIVYGGRPVDNLTVLLSQHSSSRSENSIRFDNVLIMEAPALPVRWGAHALRPSLSLFFSFFSLLLFFSGSLSLLCFFPYLFLFLYVRFKIFFLYPLLSIFCLCFSPLGSPLLFSPVSFFYSVSSILSPSLYCVFIYHFLVWTERNVL